VLVDQVLMAALVLDPGIADNTHVVGVLEHRGKLRARQRLFGLLRRGPGAQATLGQRGEQGVKRVGA
jgi:hypothetical protein